jgi:signal transduction histidine kinase
VRAKPIQLYLLLIIVIAAALLSSVGIQLVWPDRQWINQPLHSAMEALGGLAAIVMAFVLLQRRQEPGGGKFSLLALGFLSMGVLEEFHAICEQDNGEVFLRSVASLVGGIGFALVWLPESETKGIWKLRMSWLIAAGTLALGLWTLVFPDQLPQMIRDGQFTATAIATKSLACILFLAGAARFLADFRHFGRSVDYLFACLALLFSVAELMFTYSALWDSGWWFWHALRLMTYVLVLGYVSYGYLQMIEAARLAEVARLLGDIGHDVKNLLQPGVTATALLQEELNELFGRLPATEQSKAKASHALCHEVLGLLRDSSHRIQDRMKEMADCVTGLSVPLRFVSCRVASVVDSVLKTLRVLAEEKRLALHTVGLESLPPILADERRLYNAFYNLVNNAIPEVPAGGSITISGRAEPGAIVIVVADTGRGMPPDVRDSLFTKRSISLKAGGTGLGTKIIKDVVDAHGGEITVESQEDKGTTFFMRLPLQPPGSSAR